MSAVPATHQATSVLDDLQASLTRGTVARRVELLRRVTDLFLHGAAQYSDEQISLFDDVFACLVTHIHNDARAVLSHRLAPIASAPRRIIHQLARDDLIEVAAPVLAQSELLDDDLLIETARSKSQGHLMAISARRTLSGGVTDILVERGNDDVVRAVAGNPGAELSDLGYTRLIDRADGSAWITTCIAMRPAMPRHHYLRLVAKASDTVRLRLADHFPKAADDIARTIAQLTDRARTAPAAISDQTMVSRGLVQALYDDGRLDDRQVALFADATQFDEVSASLAYLARIPVALAESMLVEAQDEGILILGKVAGLSWPTLSAIMAMRTRLGRRADDPSEAGHIVYARLQSSAAHQVLRFHRMQLMAARD